MTMEAPMPSDMTGLIDRFKEISSKKAVDGDFQ